MTQTQHTHKDWYVSGNEFQSMIISEQTGDTIAVCYSPQKGAETAQANAEFIVRACNSYDDMLNACEAAVRFILAQGKTDTSTYIFLSEIIQKARGEV